MSDERDPTSHRRQHWGVEPVPVTRHAPASGDAADDPWTVEEERAAARRILWRDSASILVGVILVVLAVQLLFRGSGGIGPASDATALPSALILGPSRPAGSVAPGATRGAVLDASFGVDVPPTGSPARTQPPTGSQPPVNPPVTPRPTRRPTSAPTTPPVTPAPTPEPTPEVTPSPTDTPPPPPTDTPPPQPTDSIPPSTESPPP